MYYYFSLILETCGKLGARRIHACAIKAGLLCDVYVATAIIDAYMKNRSHGNALQLFDESPQRNLASYGAVICGFRRSGDLSKSVGFLRRLGREGLLPTAAIIAGLLPDCGSLELGNQLHGISVKLGFEDDDYVSTSLVSAYLQLGEIGGARRLFGLLPKKKVVVYNAMISGLSRNGLSSLAVGFFIELMGSFSEQPNASTLCSILSACSDLLDLQLGRQIHCYAAKRRRAEEEEDGLVGAALVNMYSKCGSPRCAQQVFESLPQRGLPAWNSMISGMFHHGLFEDAVELFQRMGIEGIRPDSTTWNLMISGFSQNGDVARAFGFFRMMMMMMPSSGSASRCSYKIITSLLHVCFSVQNLQLGKEIHGYALRSGCLYDEFVVAALLTMYMKCGDSIHASRVFDQTKRKKDIAIWNTMISGYGWNGETAKALEIITQMEREDVKPNAATFLGAISLCNQVGDVERGYKLLRIMKEVYGYSPMMEHLSCMVDLLGRVGRVEEAWCLLKEMVEPATSAYYSLLGAAACHGNAEVGETVAEKLLELDPGNPSPLVLLSKIYAERERWGDAERVRERVGKMTMKKSVGFSRIQTGKLSDYLVEDSSKKGPYFLKG